MADLGTSRIFGNLTVTRNIEAKGAITGDGSGLTSLNASNISNGTLSDGRLPFVFSEKKIQKAAHASGSSEKHLELWSPDSGDATKEVSIRFHQASQYYAQIRVRNDGFHFTSGNSNNLETMHGDGSGLTNIPHEATNFANQSLNTNSNVNFNRVVINGQIVSSGASLQVNGFMRTGNIFLHEGGNTPTSSGKALSNTGGALEWDGNQVYHEGHKPTYSELGAITTGNVTFANQYLNKGSDVLFDRVQAKLGFNGGYNDSNPSGGNWGVPIWSMGSAFGGTGSGSNFSVASNQYGLVWLRAGHPEASSFADEGLYIYRSGNTIAQLGLKGIYFSSETRAPSFKIASDKRLKNKTKQLTKTNTINVYSWEWDNHESIPEQLRKTEDKGVIAQEVENHYPQLVSEGDGGYKAVDYGKLGTIVSIENRERIEKLEALVNSLQNQSIWSLIKLKVKRWLS